VSESTSNDFCGEVIRYIEAEEPATRRVLEANPAQEEEHADDMADLLASFDPGKSV
jgi:bacterioferritin